jgi:hypothetical protein
VPWKTIVFMACFTADDFYSNKRTQITDGYRCL